MDFHSLMKKKLGGKYDQPKLAADDMAELDGMAKEDNMAMENNMAKEKDNNIEDDKEGAPETDTDEDGQVTPPRSPHLDDAMLTSPPKTTTEKSKKARRMMATFKPRVQCGECDFVGKEGREMDTHRAKKHKKKECDECSFVAELSIVFRRHKIQKHHQKCKSCEFTTAASSALKVHEQAEHGGGVLRTSAGFMITSDASNDLHLELEAPPCQDSANQRSKRKPTKSEYLRREKEVNIENKSRKDIVKSFKDAFKT